MDRTPQPAEVILVDIQQIPENECHEQEVDPFEIMTVLFYDRQPHDGKKRTVGRKETAARFKPGPFRAALASVSA